MKRITVSKGELSMDDTCAYVEEPVCRRVERQRVHCPRCSKELTLKTLRYTHAEFCRPLDERVTERYAAALKAFNDDLLAKNAPNREISPEKGQSHQIYGNNPPGNSGMDNAPSLMPNLMPTRRGYTMESAMALLNF